MTTPSEIAFALAFWIGHGFLVIAALNILHGYAIDERLRNLGILVLFAWLLGPPVVAAIEAGPVDALLGRAFPAALYYKYLCIGLAVGIFPALTVMRALRKPIAGVKERLVEAIDFERTEARERLAGSGLSAGLLRVPGNESLKLMVKECIVRVENLPEALDGLALLHISDLHFSHAYQRRFFERVFETAARFPSDFVCFTGDLTDEDEAIAWVRPLFSGLGGRLGSFAILGNHDVEHNPGALSAELEAAGYANIEERWTVVNVGSSRLAFGGTRHPWGGAPAGSIPESADCSILLSHSPDFFPRAARMGVDLTLSGHNHGGQVRLPLVGPVLMPSRFGRRYDSGFFRKRKSLLYVSRGVGGKHPLRFACAPEVTRLILVGAKPPAADSARAEREAGLQVH